MKHKRNFFLILFLTVIHPHDAMTQSPPALAGCTVLPPNNIWNVPVDSLPVDENSDAYVNTIGSTGNVHADFGSGTWDGGPIGIPYIDASGTQPKVAVSFDYADESDPGPYPIPNDAPIAIGAKSYNETHCIFA